jgi:hypothetical protein
MSLSCLPVSFCNDILANHLMMAQSPEIVNGLW